MNKLLYAWAFSSLFLFGDSIEPDVNRTHGFFDIAFKNDYITPRGLLVTNTGLTIQTLLGLYVDVYNDSCGNKASITLGIWNDLWTDQGNPYVGAWNEMDWFAGITTRIANNWLFNVQFLQFVSPPHNFKPENNVEFLFGYDDGFLNPYVKLFWAVSGDSTVVVGRKGNTYDVEIGLLPTIEFQYFTLLAPTWITVGPASFWNGGALGLKNKNCNFGVFSTGLNFKFPLIFGYIYLGGQYYYLINDSLLQAQTITLGTRHRHVGVATAGMGFSF